MYYIAKFIQATGLTIILIGFIQKFPQLMNPKTILLGIAIFTSGWIIQRFLLKGKT